MSHFVLSASSAVPITSRKHCQTFSSSLFANCCASCGLTILKLKFARVEPRQRSKSQSCLDNCNGGDPVQENCMFLGFGLELSNDVL